MNVVQLFVSGFQLMNGMGAATTFWKVASGVAFAAQFGVTGTAVLSRNDSIGFTINSLPITS